MRRRRSRLPLVVLGCIVVLVGVTAVFATTNLHAGSNFLGFLGGSAPSTSASPAPDPSGGNSNLPGSSAASGGSVGPGSADGTGSVGGTSSGAPGASSGAGTSAPGSGSGAQATPQPTVGPVVATVGGSAKPYYHGSRAKKVVALTFDDGYSPVALRQILAILQKDHVAATFFPYGYAVHADPAGWHMVVKDGYPIGNHTLTHSILTGLTPAQVTEEMTHGRATIDLYSGGTSVNLMRPPGGAFTATTEKAIAKAGYPTMVMWDVDTRDWAGLSPSAILARAIKGTNGSIVLMHAGPLNTPKALPAIIANYKKRGFTFVTVPELMAGQ